MSPWRWSRTMTGQLDLPLGPLHPLAVALLSARRSWPRGRPEGIAVSCRIVHTCELGELLAAYRAVISRTAFPPDPFPEVSW